MVKMMLVIMIMTEAVIMIMNDGGDHDQDDGGDHDHDNGGGEGWNLKETQILVSGKRLGRRSGSGDLNTRRMFPHW